MVDEKDKDVNAGDLAANILSGAPDKPSTPLFATPPSQPATSENPPVDASGTADAEPQSGDGSIPPPEMSPTPIWDENNTLVDAELDAAFKAESEKVLGEMPIPDPIDLNAPYENQQKEGQTKDPNTSPQPVHELHTAPLPPGDYGTVPPDGNTDIPVN